MPVAAVTGHFLVLKHREELVLAQLEKSVAFTLVQLLQAEDIAVKGDGFFDVADFDCDVVAAIDLDAHRWGEVKAGMTGDLPRRARDSRL
jgi:hypothetical protein